MTSHHPAKFDGYRYCSEDIIFVVVEEQDSTCFRLNLPLLFISKVHSLKAHGVSFDKSDHCQTHLNKQ